MNCNHFSFTPFKNVSETSRQQTERTQKEREDQVGPNTGIARGVSDTRWLAVGGLMAGFLSPGGYGLATKGKLSAKMMTTTQVCSLGAL